MSRKCKFLIEIKVFFKKIKIYRIMKMCLCILNVKRIFSDKILEKIKKFCMSKIYFSENHVVKEIIWKSMVETERPQMTKNAAHAFCIMEK